MNKFSLSATALAVAISAVTLTGGATTAMAGKNCTVNCNDPVKGKRNGRLWEVARCVVGSPGNYRTVPCKSSQAVHTLPTGKKGVCFHGTDGRIHYSIQKNVWEGRKFFNQEYQGKWMVNWQS